MAFKFLIMACLVAVAKAGVIAQAPLAYSTHGGPGIAVAHQAPLAYAQPAQIAYSQPAQIAYNQPLAYTSHAQPVAYAQAQPVAYAAHAQPVAYAAHAQPVAYAAHAQPIAKVIAQPIAKVEDYDAHPQYSYSYDVHDSLTGDIKSQQESRDGDVVHGAYSVVDPDGVKRTVEYTADPHNGFNAVVHREPLAHQKVLAAAPVLAKVAAPVVANIGYAPQAYHTAAAPIAYSSPAVYHH